MVMEIIKRRKELMKEKKKKGIVDGEKDKKIK